MIQSKYVSGLCRLAESTYHEISLWIKVLTKCIGDDLDTLKPKGRPIPGYLDTLDGKKTNGEQIKEWLFELFSSDGFLYGSRKLTVNILENYSQ